MKSGNESYVFVNENKNWTEAQNYCRATYTDLLNIRDAEDQNMVLSLINGDAWFGLHRDGWKWIKPTDMFPINWKSDQPDNYNGDENCGDISDGLVSDDQCTDLRPFVCSIREFIFVYYQFIGYVQYLFITQATYVKVPL